jgi:hypothetical protein
MGRKVLISNCHADKQHNLTDTVILNATTTAKSTPIADGAFYVTTVRELQSVQNPQHNFLYYDKATNEICALDYTQSDLVADLSHTHIGNARGGVGEVQLSSGAGTFKSHAFLTYDDVNHLFKIGDTTMHTFVMDATSGKLTSGKLRPKAGKHDFEVDHSNLYLHLLDSYALGGTTPLHTGYSVRSPAFTNVSKGVTSWWNTTPQFMQMSTSLGHDRDTYSSFIPLMDSILSKASYNAGGADQCMDLGSSSRIAGRRNGYGSGSSPVYSLWKGNDDNIQVSDPYVSNSYGDWGGQFRYKSHVPGLYVEERRWNMVVARENHLCKVHLRSDDAPLFDPVGNPVQGIDFYDHVVGRWESKTHTDTTPAAGVKVSRYHQYGEMGLSLSKNLASGKSVRGTVAGDLLKLSTQAPGALAGYQTGVDFTSTSLGVWGGSHIHLAQYDSTYGHALASHILLDGAGAEIKALNKIESGVLGGTGVGGSSTLSSSLHQGQIKIADAQITPNILFHVEGSAAGCELKINDTTAKTVLALRSHTTNSQQNHYVYYEQTEGLFHLSGSNAVTNGINGDNVGLMKLHHKHISVSGVDILQINSDFDLGANYPPAQKTSLINCRCSTHTPNAEGSVFSIDVAGKLHSQTDQDHNHATFTNTRATLGGKLFTNAILTAETMQLHATPKNYFNTGETSPYSAPGGYAFIECRAPNVSSSPTFRVDGDGSVKATTSISVSDGSPHHWLGGSARSLTLVAGATAKLTTRYSGAESGLALQAHGSAMGGGFSYTNMVKVVPNYGEKTCSFQLENASNTTTQHENFMFLTRETDVGATGSLYIRACPDVGLSHATFEISHGGSLAGHRMHILRSYPERATSTALVTEHLIIGDARALKVQLQGGKVGAKGQTAHLQGGLHANIIDCNKLDVEHIDIGDSTGEVRIGHGLTKDVHIDIGGGVVTCGSGYLHLGSAGHIRCSGASAVGTGNGYTNIVNTGHTGYIGTGSLIAIGKTGVRFSTAIGTYIMSNSKSYAALNEATAADGKYVVASCIEGPHAALFMRGQVHLKAHDAKINLDTARIHAGVGNALLVPHQAEDGWTQGTFGAMFQNPTVHVSNAGIWNGKNVQEHDTLTFSPDFTCVHGKIILTGTTGAKQAILEIQSDPKGNADIVVNYIVTAERKDAGYLTNHFMKDHINQYTGTKKTCGGEHTESHLDNLLGAGSWSGK